MTAGPDPTEPATQRLSPAPPSVAPPSQQPSAGPTSPVGAPQGPSPGTAPQAPPPEIPLSTPPPPAAGASPLPPDPVPTAATVASHSDACPTCRSRMAPDQRYCLECGNRRGDPRLPFMDAVVFMDSVKGPPAAAAPPSSPPPTKRLSPSATLVAGVATLVLAIGVGVLIGRSGEDSGSGNVASTPQVIKVEGGGGAATGSETAAETAGKSASGKKSGGAKSSKKKGGKEEAVETGSSGTSKAAEEVLKPSGDVKLPPPTQEVGGSCEKGTAGCSDSGEFNGDFFGE